MAHETPHARGRRVLRESGYHSDAAEDKALVKDMVKPSALKRKSGGSVMGTLPKTRPDRRGRGAHTMVNVIVGKGGDIPAKLQAAHQAGIQQGAKLGAAAVAQKLQGGGPSGGAAPAMGPPPMGAPAAPAPGPMPMAPPMRARGGSVDDSSGQPPINIRADKFSGADEAHMPPFPKQDQPIAVSAHTRRRAGGRVACD